jgi:putative membrane protein
MMAALVGNKNRSGSATAFQLHNSLMPVPEQYAIFPVINATLNGATTILLLTGRWLISRRRIAQHRLVMLTAFVTSTLFLMSYLYYHFHVGSVRFQGTGWTRPAYFTILISHVLLAIAIVPLVIVTLARALRERFDKHRAIARWTFPLWLYVSVTGVLVYFMLYKWFA